MAIFAVVISLVALANCIAACWFVLGIVADIPEMVRRELARISREGAALQRASINSDLQMMARRAKER
jgi:hypothetical protein